MVKGFRIGCCYQHSNPNLTLFIRVLKIRHVNSYRTKMRIEYRHLINGRVQYTGRGANGHTDEVMIKTEDYKWWTENNHLQLK